MAQDQIKKRENIATNTIIHVTRIVDSLRALDALQDEQAIVTFAQSDFDGSNDLKHLTPAMLASLYGGSGALDDLLAQFDANKTVLLEIRQ